MPPVVGQSTDVNVPGVTGDNTAGGPSGRFTTNVDFGANANVAGNVNSQGNVNAAGNVNAGGNLNAGMDVHARSVNAQGNVNAAGNVNARGNLNAEGDVNCHNIHVSGGDCAEEFDVDRASDPAIAPGTVMVLGDEGNVRPSRSAYDRRVAGVVSGAGHYKPGVIFDHKAASPGRVPVALLGKVFCHVDATYASIEIGDLLTTSDTPGHAMKASDPARAFGAVIGKALQPLPEGRGLVPILVALQ